MRLYLDQMLRVSIAEALRSEGHDVLRASEVGQERADDREIHERGIVEGRVLITLDHHFGDWAVLPLSNHPGVIRIRVHPPKRDSILALLLPFLKSHESAEVFRNHLVIISKNGARWVKTSTQ